VRRKLEELPEEQLKPPPLVTGADLIAAGYEPGPRFAEMLARWKTPQLEGRAGSREEAMKMVREDVSAMRGDLSARPGYNCA